MFNQQPAAAQSMPQSFNSNTSFSQLPNAMKMSNSTAMALPMNSNITGMNNQMKEPTDMCTMVPNTQGNFMFNGMNNNGMPMNGGSPYMNNMNPMCMGMMPAYMPQQLMMQNYGGMMPNFMPNAYGQNSMMGFPNGMVSNMNGMMPNGNCFMANPSSLMVGMNQNGNGMNQNGYGMNQNGYGMMTPNMGGGNFPHGGNNLPMLSNDETRFQSSDRETKKTRESGNQFF